MKILLVSNMYPSEEHPSYGVFVKNQVDLLKAEGIEVELQVMYRENNTLRRILLYLLHYIQVFKKYIFSDYDLVYIHYASMNAIPILLGSLIKKRKIIVNVHGSDVIPETSLQNKINFLTSLLLGKTNLVIVPSKYYETTVSQKYNISKSNIYVSPSGGINRNLFREKADSNSNDGLFKIGYVGRIDVGKGWDDLLHALSIFLKSNSNIQLIMIGDGKEIAQRNQLINELNLNHVVQLRGLLSQEELVNVYNEIDLFIFPTKRKAESLGLVGLEAMSCGTPIVGSKIGGVESYLIDNWNGYFTEPGNAKDIAEKIITYYSLEQKTKDEMKRNALNTAEKFDEEVVKKDFIKMLYNILV